MVLFLRDRFGKIHPAVFQEDSEGILECTVEDKNLWRRQKNRKVGSKSKTKADAVVDVLCSFLTL